MQAEPLYLVVVDNLRRKTVNISYILRESSKTMFGYAEYVASAHTMKMSRDIDQYCVPLIQMKHHIRINEATFSHFPLVCSKKGLSFILQYYLRLDHQLCQ